MDTAQVRILVDTNVWLDLFVPHRAGGEVARRFFKRCSRDDVMLLCSAHAPQDVFFTVAREAKRFARSQDGAVTETWAHAICDHAWGCARRMQELATVAGVDQADYWLAEKYRDLHPDLEDDIVIAVARRVKADYLVTSDKKLIAKSPVAALTPEDMLTVLNARG